MDKDHGLNKNNLNNRQSRSSIIRTKILPVLGVFIIAIAVIALNNNGAKVNTDDITKVVDGDIRIPLDDISDIVTFYPASINGTDLEVLALKAPDGTIRTAFNTCQVCYNSGRGYYEQEGSSLICQNCGNSFGLEDVEVTRGGCNPVPITDEFKVIEDDKIIIPLETLEQATVIFANWDK